MVGALFLWMVKSKDDMVILPFSLLHALSKNPQDRGLIVGIEKIVRWLMCCFAENGAASGSEDG